MQTEFIVIASAKGGVGKSTTAINLSAALNDFGRNIVLVDGNANKPNIGLMLGITKLKSSLHDSLRGEQHITDSVYIHPSGLQVIPGSILYDEIYREQHIKLEEAIMPLRGKCEFIIIDSGPGFNKETEEVLSLADKVILITTPDLSSITDTVKTKKYCQDKGIEILGVVVTHTKNKDFEIKLQDIEIILEDKVIGEIPYDENIPESQHHKYPVTNFSAESKSAIAFKKLAANLIGEEYIPEKKIGLFEYVLKKLGFS